jgi:hypothetical protein
MEQKNSSATDRAPQYGRPTNPDSRTAKAQPAPTRPALAPFVADPELFAIGFQMADRVFESGDWQRLRCVYADTKSQDEGARRNGLSVLFGLAVRGATIMEAVGREGHVRFVGGSPPSAQDVMYAWKTSLNRFILTLNSLSDVMARTTAAAPGLRVGSDKPAPKEEPPAPVPVSVVSLPARVASTEIERDGAGDIKRSTMIEVDFKKAPANAG